MMEEVNNDVEMQDQTSRISAIQIAQEANLPLIEKYRPKRLSDMVSHEEILTTINMFVERKNIPHFLFHGPPGTGKTSCILALARQLYGDNFKKMTLELNASDDRGINVVRERIKEFCNTLMLSSKGVKLVILDEADMMTSAAQFALRRVIEKYTKNARFCLICNQVSKIIPAIQSRCMRFRFSPLKKEQCFIRLTQICEKEKIPIDEKTIEKIIEIGKGDMRKILNILESTSMSYGNVNVENVFSCTGLPSDSQVQFILDTIWDKQFSESFQILLEFKNSNGFSMNDLTLELLKRVKYLKDLDVKQKIGLFRIFRKMDYSNNIGGSEKLALGNLIGAISSLKR
jgi:replication factor C subunit 3/5